LPKASTIDHFPFPLSPFPPFHPIKTIQFDKIIRDGSNEEIYIQGAEFENNPSLARELAFHVFDKLEALPPNDPKSHQIVRVWESSMMDCPVDIAGPELIYNNDFLRRFWRLAMKHEEEFHGLYKPLFWHNEGLMDHTQHRPSIVNCGLFNNDNNDKPVDCFVIVQDELQKVPMFGSKDQIEQSQLFNTNDDKKQSKLITNILRLSSQVGFLEFFYRETVPILPSSFIQIMVMYENVLDIVLDQIVQHNNNNNNHNNNARSKKIPQFIESGCPFYGEGEFGSISSFIVNIINRIPTHGVDDNNDKSIKSIFKSNIQLVEKYLLLLEYFFSQDIDIDERQSRVYGLNDIKRIFGQDEFDAIVEERNWDNKYYNLFHHQI